MRTTQSAPRLNVEERIARGRAARARIPRSSHAAFSPSPRRPDPVALLEKQAATRVPELVAIRYGRMLATLGISPDVFRVVPDSRITTRPTTSKGRIQFVRAAQLCKVQVLPAEQGGPRGV
jgi:hypothetical protein